MINRYQKIIICDHFSLFYRDQAQINKKCEAFLFLICEIKYFWRYFYRFLQKEAKTFKTNKEEERKQAKASDCKHNCSPNETESAAVDDSKDAEIVENTVEPTYDDVTSTMPDVTKFEPELSAE